MSKFYIGLFFLLIIGTVVTFVVINSRYTIDYDSLDDTVLPVTQQSTQSAEKVSATNDTDTVESVDTQKQVADTETYPDWATDTKPSPTIKTDAFTRYIIQQERAEEDTSTKNPTEMPDDHARDVIFKTLLKRHGDIPAVHILMEYERKSQYNIPMTLAEEVRGLEAVYELFPTAPNLRNLQLHKWMASKGPDGMQSVTEDDVKYLRGLGISVDRKLTKDGTYVTNISTK